MQADREIQRVAKLFHPHPRLAAGTGARSLFDRLAVDSLMGKGRIGPAGKPGTVHR